MEPVLAELADITRVEIRRGYRDAGIGAAVGLGLFAALVAVIGRVRVNVRPGLLFGAASALIGAAFGMWISTARIDRRRREAMKTDSDIRRIAEVVFRGKPDQLSEEEKRR